MEQKYKTLRNSVKSKYPKMKDALHTITKQVETGKDKMMELAKQIRKKYIEETTVPLN